MENYKYIRSFEENQKIVLLNDINSKLVLYQNRLQINRTEIPEV